MKIPNNNLSFVPDNKISDYLLSDNHETEKHKAEFLKSFGFNLSDVESFKGSLTRHSTERDIEKKLDSELGVKYELRCEIKTPDNRNPCIVTVWIVENEKIAPRLVTAYPSK